MGCLPGYPHLTILSFSPSLSVNSDGLHHLALKRGRGLRGGEGERGVVVKFTESVVIYTQLCLK